MAHPLQIGSWVLPTSDCLARRKTLPWDLKRGIEGPQMGGCQCSESQLLFPAFLPGLFVKPLGLIGFIRAPFALLKFFASYSAAASPTLYCVA